MATGSIRGDYGRWETGGWQVRSGLTDIDAESGERAVLRCTSDASVEGGEAVESSVVGIGQAQAREARTRGPDGVVLAKRECARRAWLAC